MPIKETSQQTTTEESRDHKHSTMAILLLFTWGIPAKIQIGITTFCLGGLWEKKPFPNWTPLTQTPSKAVGLPPQSHMPFFSCQPAPWNTAWMEAPAIWSPPDRHAGEAWQVGFSGTVPEGYRGRAALEVWLGCGARTHLSVPEGAGGNPELESLYSCVSRNVTSVGYRMSSRPDWAGNKAKFLALSLSHSTLLLCLSHSFISTQSFSLSLWPMLSVHRTGALCFIRESSFLNVRSLSH